MEPVVAWVANPAMMAPAMRSGLVTLPGDRYREMRCIMSVLSTGKSFPLRDTTGRWEPTYQITEKNSV